MKLRGMGSFTVGRENSFFCRSVSTVLFCTEYSVRVCCYFVEVKMCEKGGLK